MSDDLEVAFNAALEGADNIDSDFDSDYDLSDNAEINMGDDLVDESDDDTSGDDTVSSETGDDTDDDDGISDDTPAAFDWSEHKDKLVTVKVDGELIQVPLAEAMNGYMRQKHFTQQTQAMAEERRLAAWAHELQTAIQNDPKGTLRSLQAALGLDSIAPEADPFEDLDPEVQPLARALEAQKAEMRRLQEAMQAQEAQAEQQRIFAEVKAEVAEVRSKYDDFNAQEVLPLAAERGLSVEDAYKLWKADQFLQSEATRRKAEAAAAKRAEEAAAKRSATKKVNRGGSSSGSAGDSVSVKDMSFEELLLHQLSKAQ